MQRLLPALAAFALVIAGVGAGILFLTARDESSITASTPSPAAQTGTSPGPYGLAAGNVVVTYSRQSDRIRIDQLAERLGAIDTDASRAAGQALVSKSAPGQAVQATNGVLVLEVPSATDPRLAAFVRANLGRTP